MSTYTNTNIVITHLFALLGLALLAAATPAPAPSVLARDQTCTTAPIQCCNQVMPAGNAVASTLLGAVGVVVQDLSLPIGIACAPLEGIGLASGSTCSELTVCCEDNSHGTLISIGCIPIIL
ncbi:fungal hydrophobin-domain-containing protein [Lenzites betulinus]|nr:fungal hydrophobin-domain-containing protein [Lenzites betulinus]